MERETEVGERMRERVKKSKIKRGEEFKRGRGTKIYTGERNEPAPG